MAKLYEKPVFRKVSGISFVIKYIRSTWQRVACRQCSACHGCR